MRARCAHGGRAGRKRPKNRGVKNAGQIEGRGHPPPDPARAFGRERRATGAPFASGAGRGRRGAAPAPMTMERSPRHHDHRIAGRRAAGRPRGPQRGQGGRARPGPGAAHLPPLFQKNAATPRQWPPKKGAAGGGAATTAGGAEPAAKDGAGRPPAAPPKAGGP